MSTRCTINFCYPAKSKKAKTPKIVAKIYRHCDGYPDTDSGVLANLQEFFAAVEADTKDTRFGDPSYLAAKFVVWQAGQNARTWDYKTNTYTSNKPLDFISLGICTKDPEDIEYTYFVVCGDGDRPEVIHQEAPSPK